MEFYAVRDEDHIVPNEVVEWHPAWDGTDERRCWRCGFSPAAGIELGPPPSSRPICGDCLADLPRGGHPQVIEVNFVDEAHLLCDEWRIVSVPPVNSEPDSQES